MKRDLCESIAGFFIKSPLTVVFLMISFVVGTYALVQLPREEEPQINVPMVDIFVQANGLKAIDAAQLVTKPLEDIIRSIEGVEHVYSNTQDDQAMVTARFYVGEDEDRAILRVHESIRAHLNEIPYGIPMPLVISRGINDVPILVIALTPKTNALDHWNDSALHSIATKLTHELSKISNVGETFVIGGHPSQIRIEPNPEKLRLYGVTLNQLVDKVHYANKVTIGSPVRDNQQIVPLVAGQTFQSVENIGNLFVTTYDGRPVYLSDVANIVLSAKQDEQNVYAYKSADERVKPAVTVAVAKRKGANAVDVAQEVLSHLESLQAEIIPNSLDIDIVRNYGKTAQDKSNSLLMSLASATFTIVLIITLLVGWREGITVLFVIPTTLLLTLFCTYLFGYTINRVSLFALVFAIGILVDDAIVITENIGRHWRKGGDKIASALVAVKEIGTPTIMANLTILAALLPMLFVSGMMGPYMSPIPINASSAVILSLLVALIISPWLMAKLYRNKSFDITTAELNTQPDIFGRFYSFIAKPIIASKVTARMFLWGVTVLTLIMLCFFPLKWVSVKMLPFDNKPELQVIVEAKEGTATEITQRILQEIAIQIKQISEVESQWLHVGTPAAFNFNGLVRHYYLRKQPHQGEIVVRLKSKDERKRKSHTIALELREKINALSLPEGTTIGVVEMPPGPPVLATLLAEIYGPNASERRDIADNVKQIFNEIEFIKDVDTNYGQQQDKIQITLNNPQIEFYGVEEEAVIDTLQALFNPIQVGFSNRGEEVDPIEITLQLNKRDLQLTESLLTTPVPSKHGTVELGELVNIQHEKSSYPIFRRNGRDVEMVMGDLAGQFEAPIYGMLAVNEAIKEKMPDNVQIKYFGQPQLPEQPTLLWEGEWEVTYVTFRDLGFAFVFAMIGIYILLIIQFNSLRLPLLVLTPVPLTFIGIIFGHWLFSAHFTATSMIGFIALGGIIIRNALLLVEFIRNQQAQNMPLEQALLIAGQIRFRPIFLTAVTAMIGAAFMIPDPIFEGLGIALLFGLISSTLLTVLVIPALYVVLNKKL